MASRLIRYLEDGVWKYASVKDIGDLEILLTENKQDIVSAINELVANGGATRQEVIDLKGVTTGLNQKIEDTIADVIKKADLEYVDGQLIKKIDTTRYETEYNKVKEDLLDKVNIDEYTEDYNNIVANLEDKVDSIEYQSKVDALNQSIANQQTEITTAKNDITTIDTKVNNTKTELTGVIDSLEEDVIQQSVDLENAKLDLQGKINTTNTSLTAINGDITSLKQRASNVEGSVTSINTEIDDVRGEISTTVANLTNVEGRISEAETTISQQASTINMKAEKTDVYTKGETDTKLGEKVDTTTYNNKVAEIELNADGITQTVSSLQSDIGTGAEGETGTIKSEMSRIEQKADGISQTVSSLSGTVDGQGTRLSNAETTINQQATSIGLKANASDVYTKAQVNTELGKKVDTSVYNTKMSAIDLSVNGVSQTVSSMQGEVTTIKDDLGNVEDDITTINTNVSNVDQKADSIQSTVTGLQTTVTSQGQTISSHGTSITQLNNSITSKAEKSDVYTKTEADGKISSAITTAKSEIKQTTDGITSTVSSLSGKVTGIEGTIGTGAVGETGTIKSEISRVDQKADSIQSTVSSLNTTVTGQGTRLSNAETTIGQHTTSINLKANASDVYKKGEVDTALGKKVDTTTYNTKMSAIDVSINGINQTVSSQTTKINDVTGTVTSHTSQISTLDQRADGFDLKVQEIEGDISGVEGRVSSAETQITANKSAIELKASQTSVDSLTGRVGTAEGKIDVQAGQIAQRVTKTEYDENVGLNKWIVSRYNMNLGSTTSIPAFSHIQGKKADEIVEFADAQRMQPFTGENYVAHFFTNVYLDNAKTVTLNITADDTVATFMNGAKISEAKASVALSLRKGWNTVEFLFYEHTGGEYLDLGLKLSSQVTKLTAHIGIGDKNDTRLSQAETSIIQNSDAIKLKASQTDVTSLGNRVSATEGSITVLNNAITSKVEQSDFNAYSQRLSTAESTITQHATDIQSRVKQTDFNLLNGRVGTAETTITQHTNAINLRVTTETFNALAGRVGTTETSISALEDAIELKASQTNLDTVSGRLTTAEGKITANATAITQKVSQTDFNALKGRMDTAETTITQTSNAITLKADKDDLDELDGRVGDAEAQLTVQAGQIASKVASTDVYLKKDVDDKLAGKTDTSTFNALVTRVNTAETNITQTSGQIALKANASDVYTKTETNTELGKKANQSDLTTVQGTVNDMNSDMKVTPVEKSTLKRTLDQIKNEYTQLTAQATALGVAKTDLDTAYNKLNGETPKIEAEVLLTMNTTYTFGSSTLRDTFNTKISTYFAEAEKLRKACVDKVNGVANTASTNASSAVTTANTANSTANTAKSTADSASTTANTAKSTAESAQSTASTANTNASNAVSTANTANTNASNAVTTANSAKSIADTAKSNVDDMMSDLKVTPLEKQTLSRDWESIKAENGQITAQATALGVSKTAYDSAYALLDSTTPKIASEILATADMAKTYTFGSTTLRDTFKTKLNAYFLEAEKLRKALTDKINGTASTANSTANTANTTANTLRDTTIPALATRVSTAESSLTVQANEIASKVSQTDFDSLAGRVGNAESSITQQAGEIALRVTSSTFTTELGKKASQSALDTTNTNVTTAQSTANNAKSTADGVKSTVDTNKSKWDTASTDATNAKNALADMSSDDKLTPVEKQQLKKEWATISAEKAQYESLATTYGISTEKTNYVNAHNALNTKLNDATNGYLISMTTTTNLGTGGGATFRATFDDYYDKKAQLIKKINETSRTLANNAQGTANTANTTANTANSTANTLRDTTIPALTTRLSTAESSITQTQSDIALKVNKTDVYTKTETDGKVNGIVVGGKNLLLKSDASYDTTSYLINQYTLSEDFIAGQDYTFVIKGTVPSGQKLGIWMNGGSSNVGYATTKYVDGVTYVTFKAVTATSGNERKLSLYNYPSNTTQGIVDWVALYKGNKPMDWTPAPEDIQTSIDGKADSSVVETLTSEYNTSLIQTSNNITTSVEQKITDAKGDIEKAYKAEVKTAVDNFNISFNTVNKSISDLNAGVGEVTSYFDFNPEGLTIGKSDSPLNITVSNEKIDFLDNGSTVAYINGKMMYIDSLEVLTSLLVGNHKIEKYNSDITLIKYSG